MNAADKMRHYCVFAVNVPAGGADRIVWHFGRDYKEYSVPAHSGSPYLRVDDLFFPTDRADPGPPRPIRRARGAGGDWEGASEWEASRARGGACGRAAHPDARRHAAEPGGVSGGRPYTGPPKTFTVFWQKYSDPPDVLEVVTFSESASETGPAEGTVTTTATFSEPGEYVLLTQVIDGGFENQCCWTNGYV